MRYYKISFHNMLVQYHKKIKKWILEFQNILINSGNIFIYFLLLSVREYLYFLLKFTSGHIHYLLFTLINSGNIFIYFLNLYHGTFKSYQAHFMRYYWFKFYSQTIKRQPILLKWYYQQIGNRRFLFEVLTRAKSILKQLNNAAFVFTRLCRNEVPVSLLNLSNKLSSKIAFRILSDTHDRALLRK